MPITKFFTGLSSFGFAFAPGGDFEPIATVTVPSAGSANIEFTSIPGTYQHLQLRMIAPFNAQDAVFRLDFNGSSTGYAYHWLNGQGVNAAAYAQSSVAFIDFAYDHNITRSTTFLKASVLDILDYASTSKNKTTRALSGIDRNGSGAVQVESGLWSNTAAITSMRIRHYGNDGVSYGYKNFVQHSTAALYGVRS